MRHPPTNLLRALFAVLLLGLFSAVASGDGSQADYKRADALYLSKFGSVCHRRVFPHWTPDGNAFWYMSINSKWKQQYWWVDAIAGSRKPAFDQTRFAAAVKAAQIMPSLDPDFLSVEDIAHDSNGNLLVTLYGKIVTVNPDTYAVKAEQSLNTGRYTLRRLDSAEPSALPDEGDDFAIIRKIVNYTPGPININRVHPDGSQQCIRSLVGTTWDPIYCCTGEVFVATDAGKRFLGAFRITGDGGTIVVGTPEKPATAPTTSPTTSPTTVPTTAPTTLPTTFPTTRPATMPVRFEPGESPDHKWIAFIKDRNVWLRDRRDGREFRLSTSGREGNEYPADIPLTWSPNSNSLLAMQRAITAHPQIDWLQSCPPDQLRQKLDTKSYILPGEPIPTFTVHLFDMNSRRQIPIRNLDISNPQVVTAAAWDNDPPTFGLYYLQRGHQHASVISIDATTGRTTTIVDERSSTFISAQNPCWRYAHDGHELYWASERDGWNHLYRYDTVKGELMNQVTRGQWVVEPWDESLDQIKGGSGVYFHARGVNPDQDPYYVHYCWISSDGAGLTDLTPADGTHEIQRSPDGRFFLDTYSRVDQPPITELRHYDGKLICPVDHADASELLASGWRYPERFVAKGRDGNTDIHGVIYRPSNFDPNKHYPVIEDIYAWPQTASVPKAFTRWTYPMTVAELGFIVVQIDGMGTPGRGKAFQDVCWHNLRDCGLYDRIAWMQAAAAVHPEMDLARVGIYGGSGGGYAALRALEDHGDFYKVAVAYDGPHDPRLYQQWYIEQYMGWPLGPWYAEQSNADPVAIARMNGKLLLMVSELDHNVQPAATMRVVDALVKANKDFDFVEIPNADHGGGGEYADRRRKDFLVKNLLGVQPRGR